MADQEFPRGAVGRELSKVLAPGEPLVDFASGKGGIVLAATDRRAIIVKGSIGTGTWFGRESHSYGYQQITSIEIHSRFLDGYVEITAGGVQQRKLGRVGQMHAENMVPFNKGREGDFRRVVAAIQQRMFAGVAPQPMAAPDIPQQIAALAQLRQQGVLSAAEFEAKKAELLRRM